MILLGLILFGIGALGALATVALVATAAPGGGVDVTILGSTLGTWSSSTLLWVTVGAAAGTGVAVVLAAWTLGAGRRRGARREREALAADIDRLNTVRRLLEERVDTLGGDVRDLDRISVAAMPDAPIAPPAQEDRDDVIVLPEAPPMARA